MKGRSVVWISLLALAWTACSNPAPQRPAQRLGSEPKPDSAQLALLELNRRLADAADKQLAELVQTQPETYALYDGNTWMHIFTPGDTDSGSPEENSEWTLRMRTYDLEGKLLVDSEGTYRIGRHELPQAVDANIRELHHGARARLYAPWYSAYGLTGNEQIGQYENIIIEIELR